MGDTRVPIIETCVITRISIASRPIDVFKYLVNLKYHLIWIPHLQSISPLTKLKLGTVYKSTILLLGLIKVNGQNLVTKLVPDRELAIENKIGPLQYNVRWFLRPKNDSTILICTAHVTADMHTFGFVSPELNHLVRTELRTELRSLKKLVEHGGVEPKKPPAGLFVDSSEAPLKKHGGA